MSFDSILVRLKVDDCIKELLKEAFRFHTGSIKSRRHQTVLWYVLMFRFHTGSIKSR